MRPIKVRPRWHCDFCRYTSSSISGMERHEKICWSNPHRFCELCHNTGTVGDGYTDPIEPCYYCSQFEPDIYKRIERSKAS